MGGAQQDAELMNRHTLQSLQRSKSHRAEHFARLRARREAAIRARPAPVYPPITRPGAHTDEWIEVRLNGHTVRVQLGVPGGIGRSDQRSAWIDDALLTRAAGLTWLFDRVRAMLPAAPSRRLLAGLQQGYSLRDEADASSAS
jgi:hypothetical protein